MFTLKQLHVGLINAHTLACLVSNILSNKEAYRRPFENHQIAGSHYFPSEIIFLVATWVGLGELAGFDLMLQKPGVLHFLWPLFKAEEDKKRPCIPTLV